MRTLTKKFLALVVGLSFIYSPVYADNYHVKTDSGSVTAATQSGTWTVQPGNTPNTVAWKVDGSAVTQPVSASSLPLPTGASTLSEQQTQTTALQLIDDGVYTDDTSTHSTGSSKGYGIMATATPTDTAINANDIGMLAMTLNRELLVQVNTALPAGSNAIGKLAANSGVDIGDVDITSVIPGTGATNLGKAEDVAHSTGDTGVAVWGVRDDTLDARSNAENDYEPFHMNLNGALWTIDVNSASFLTSLQLIDDPIVADDAGFTAGTTKVNAVGFVADEASTDSVNEDDIGAARMTLDRKQIVTLQPHTSGGLSTFMASGSDGSSILVATAQAIKASAGQMYGYYAYNPEAAVTFVHFYNTAAASVTVGTTNPLFTIAIPAGSAANLMFPNGVTFSNAGWSCSATTTAGGNTAPATGVSLVVWYA